MLHPAQLQPKLVLIFCLQLFLYLHGENDSLTSIRQLNLQICFIKQSDGIYSSTGLYIHFQNRVRCTLVENQRLTTAYSCPDVGTFARAVNVEAGRYLVGRLATIFLHCLLFSQKECSNQNTYCHNPNHNTTQHNLNTVQCDQQQQLGPEEQEQQQQQQQQQQHQQQNYQLYESMINIY